MKRYIGIFVIAVLASCSSSEKGTTGNGDSTAVTADSIAVNQVKVEDPQIASIYSNYIGLKDALIASDYEASKSSAQALLVSLNEKEGCESTALLAQKIGAAKDIAAQRKEFTFLSSDVIAMFKHADVSSGTIFVQHCPMANNGNGGDWLSSEKNIRNPYYGDEMMECGAVIEEIK